MREQVETHMGTEKQIAKAAMMTEDWKQNQNRSEEMPTQSMKTAVKLSLVQGDKPENIIPVTSNDVTQDLMMIIT